MAGIRTGSAGVNDLEGRSPLASGLSLWSPLRQYQWDGVAFLASRSAGLLADQMGLGKTVQAAVALRLVLARPDCNRALIVCPASLCLNWELELNRWVPDVAIRRLQGPIQDRLATYRLPIPILIASFEQVRLDSPLLPADVRFDLVIVDEAQRIKNASSSTAESCRLLPRHRSWALTGTPLQNRVDDLISIFQFIKRGLLARGMTREEIHARIQPLLLRRTKDVVLTELPEITYQDVLVELTPEQRAGYDALWDERESVLSSAGTPVSHASMLALITRLKQLCNIEPETGASSKADVFRTIVESLEGPTQKLLLFSQYVSTLRWLADRVDDFPVDLYHGDLDTGQRAASLARFAASKGPRALFATYQAGGVGLNIPTATVVVLFDRWWNPAVEDQAIERAHRFGRRLPLLVYRFLCADSIEERIEKILASKRLTVRAYVDEAPNASGARLERDELRRILGLNVVEEDSLTGESKQL
jgi:SNF2 family DNA or RNA helicase